MVHVEARTHTPRKLHLQNKVSKDEVYGFRIRAGCTDVLCPLNLGRFNAVH